MKLIISPTSPYVRKVRVMIREANLLDAVEEVSVVTSPLDSHPDAIAANPMGKIPSLVRTDGPAIHDSRVITRYLDDHAGAGLYPASRLWEVLTLEATADAILDASVSMAYEIKMRPEHMQYDVWIEAQWEKVDRSLAAINERWMSHLAGPLDAAQIGVACALSYIDLRHDARNWRAKNKALADWHAEFCKRDSMIATVPPAA